MHKLRSTIAVALILSVFSITCARNPKTPNTISASQSCQGLPLGDSKLTPELTQSLVQCLNQNHRIEPWANLLNGLQEEDFKSLVRLVDTELVSSANARHHWIQTYDYLEKNGLKKEFYSLIETLFQDPALLFALKDFVLSLADEEKLSDDPLIPFFFKDLEDQDFHKTMKLVSEVLEAPAAISLMSHTRDALPIESIAKWYLGYFKNGLSYGKTEVGRQFLQSLRDGSFFKMVHEALGEDGEFILERTKKMAILSDVSYRDEAKFTENALSLILDLNKNPPSCARGSFKLNNPVLLPFFELAAEETQENALQLVRRDFALQSYFLKNFCEVDATTTAKMDELFAYLHQPQFPYFHELILIFKKHGLLQRLADLITNPAMSSYLVPLLGELYDEESFPNWLLLLNLWSSDQEKSVEKFAERLLRVEANWDGKSAYDLLLSRFEKVPFAVWLKMANGFHHLNEESARNGIRWSQFWQRVSLSTHQHPVEDFLSHSIQAVSEDKEIRRAIFQLLKHPEFENAVKFLSQSAKSGTLEQIIEFLVTAFRKTAEREKTENLSWIGSASSSANHFRHRFAAEDVKHHQSGFIEPKQANFQACRNIKTQEEAVQCLKQPNGSSVWIPFWSVLAETDLLKTGKSFLESTILNPSELNSIWKNWVTYREDEVGNQWLEWLRLSLKYGWIQTLVKWWGELSDARALERALFLEALTKNLNEGRCSVPENQLQALKSVTGWSELEKSGAALKLDSDYSLLEQNTLEQDWKAVCEAHPEIRAELARLLNSKFFSELIIWAKKNPELVSQVFQSLENGLYDHERLEVINRLERWLD